MFIFIIEILSLKLICRIECLKPESKVAKLLFSIVKLWKRKEQLICFLLTILWNTMYDDVPFVVLWKNPKNSPDAFQDKILRPVIIKKFAKNLQFWARTKSKRWSLIINCILYVNIIKCNVNFLNKLNVIKVKWRNLAEWMWTTPFFPTPKLQLNF